MTTSPELASTGMIRPVLAAVVVAAIGAVLLPGPAGSVVARPTDGPHVRPGAESSGCETCHAGIEDMHPAFALTCVDCHGGNGTATTADGAHVKPERALPNDERIVPLDYDLSFRRFVNPADLRVAQQACGGCHAGIVADVKKSLHGTTAGHLSDGLFENGVVKKRGTSFSIFPVAHESTPKSPHGLKELSPVGGFQPSAPADEIPTHYRDVVRKNCMQCHLWSRGRAVRGRLGLDGDYRSEGCAACHVTYSDTGFSTSADTKIDHKEPGHPLKHAMTSKIPTDTCTRCHYGDAQIGLSFRGLAQLVPGQPAGPDVPGTTAKRLNGNFYVRDDSITPPDVHHQRGMHCIDCHTSRDTMGDGEIYPVMDHAVEVECSTCHGTIEAEADLKTAAGRSMKNLVREGQEVFLVSKVTGARHRVKQAKNVVDALHPDFRPMAREAMTKEHGKLECYACHAGWTVNFYGFHFDRNESFTQLELISGQRTPGRVNTLEKVFATFKQFQLGLNHEDAFSTYVVGFSTFCTAYDATGKVVIDQRMPKSANGLSGMTLIHHQTHSTRPEARSCVECHRSGSTWGLGSGSFRLGRGLVASATPKGVALVATDRKTIAQSVAMAEVPVENARDVAVVTDPINGFTETIYAATAQGITVISTANPAFPDVRAKIAVEGGVRAVLATDRTLYAASGRGGVLVYELKDRLKPELVARVPVQDARGLAHGSLCLFVADGVNGLTTLDVADPRNPSILSNLKLGRVSPTDPPDAGCERVAVFFQYSRPAIGDAPRSRARHLAVAGGLGIGLHLIDVTEPTRPFIIKSFGGKNALEGINNGRLVGVEIVSKYDLGSAGGGIPSVENDYVYAAIAGERNSVQILRVSDPRKAERVETIRLDARPTGLATLRLYNPPFLVHDLVIPTTKGLRIADVTRSEQPAIVAKMDDLVCSGGVAVESMPLDRVITEEGIQLKDIAHEHARYVTAAELRRILRTRIPYNAPDPADDQPDELPNKEKRPK